MSKPFGTDIPSSTSAGLRVDAIRLVSAFANGTYTDQDALQASAMLRNLLEEIERLRDELQMAKDAALEDNEIERLHADNQAAVRAYAAEINEAKAEIERLRKELEGEHQNFIGAVRAYAEEITEASGEIERLRTELGDVSEKLMIAGTDLAGARAEIERLREDNETLNEIIKVHGDEINRLRAERDDKRELLQQLRFIRTHLYAATVQRSPADDKIIADHVEQAYLRANEVIAEMEKCDE